MTTAGTEPGAGRPSLVVLISGRGSNLQAILDAIRDGRLNADLRAVISNDPDAPGLEYARRSGIPTEIVDHRNYPSREAFDTAYAAIAQGVADWVPRSDDCNPALFADDFNCLAGASTTSGPGALIRGGDFENGSVAGVFAVNGGNQPSLAVGNVGFRCGR